MNEIIDRPIMVHITTQRQPVGNQLFDELFFRMNRSGVDELGPEPIDPPSELPQDDTDPSGYRLERDPEEPAEQMELFSEGTLTVTDDRVSLQYEETELTGMVGTTSEILFHPNEPTLVHLTRSGIVSSSMTFKPHARVACVYQTPYMPFQLGIHCLAVENNLLHGGMLCLNYIIEIRGAKAEWCHMQIDFKEIQAPADSNE